MNDRDFYRVFSGLLGALVALTVVLFVLATIIVSGARAKQKDVAAEKAIAARIQPVGEVAAGGMMDSVMPSANATPAGAPKAAGGGKATFDSTCSACHAAGVAGAPKFGDKAAWKDRIAKGMATLDEHALKGFQGKSGFMPPKGGNASLKDEDVKAAAKYMVDHAK